MALEVPELSSGNPQLQRALNKIANAEQKPIDKFDKKIQDVQDKSKIVTDLKTKFSEIRDAIQPIKNPKDFRELAGTSSHPDVVNVTSIDKDQAIPGTYDFEVMNLANTNSIMTYGFPDKDKAQIGVGYVSFKTPEGEDREVYINSDNNTLDGVARAVNAANMGVRAQVVHDGTDSEEPWRLVITGEKTGWKDNFEWPEFHFLDGDLDFDRERLREGKSAIVKFNGHPVMTDENKIKDLLPGVTLDLKNAKPGQIVTVEIKPDIEKVEAKVKNFVDKMNAVLGFINSQNAPGSDYRKDKTKLFQGDVGLQSIESRLRGMVQKSYASMDSTEIERLKDVGITFNRGGTLDFDQKKFQSQLEKNFDGVTSLMAGNGGLGGFANEISTLVEGVVRTGDGVLTMKENAAKQQVERLQKDKARAETRAETRMERVKMQFARTEGAIQKMQQMSGAAASISGGGGGIPVG